MASALKTLPMVSSYRGALSPACAQCAEGRKMVLFVSGLCRFRCFYCPVSARRNQVDVTYANERRVERDEDVLDEVRAMGASGTGITGGDPLGAFERTLHYVRLLKEEFGPSHNLHLYTHEPNPTKLRALAAAGLDEFRLHIPHYLYGPLTGAGQAYRNVLEQAPAWGLRRGVELPVLPEKVEELRRLIRAIDEIGVDFVNLNELEFSETNEAAMLARGYHTRPDAAWAADGSREAAQRLVREHKLRVPIHFCSSGFKDAVQLRHRLQRRAERTAPPFAQPTSDGTIVFGIVEATAATDICRVGRTVARLGRLGPDEYRVDAHRRRVELGAVPLRRFAARLRLPAFEVEVYPTAEPLEVEREPLNAAAFPGTRTGGS